MSEENANEPAPVDDTSLEPTGSSQSANKAEAGPHDSPSTTKWFLGCLAIAILLGFVAAHSPARVRLIALFPIAVGVLLGVVVSHLSLRFRQRLVTAVYTGAVLSGLTMVIMFVESHRLYAAGIREAYSIDPSAMLRASARNQAANAQDDPDAAEATAKLQDLIDESDAARKQALDELAGFPRYLHFRVRGLGDLDEPIPLCIAILEVALGVVGCCVMIRICIVKHHAL